MQLSEGSISNSYIQRTVIDPPGLTQWAYIHRQGEISENKNVIQVIVENDSEYEIKFYKPEEQKENTILNALKGTGFEHSITKIMGKNQG